MLAIKRKRDYDAPMNPQTTVAEILATGLTQSQLAKLVPCSQSQVSAFLRGARGHRISKNLGDRLEQIHAERCMKKTE